MVLVLIGQKNNNIILRGKMGGGAMNVDIPTFPCKTSSSILPSPNPTSSGLNVPVSVNNTPSLQQSYSSDSCCNCHSQTESSAGRNDIFGPAPSQIEVEAAISGLQNFLRKNLLDTLGGDGNGRVKEAFRLLQSEPNIQRVVFSISSDKAVWDAVMNNEMVRQLQESYVFTAHSHRIQGLKGEFDLITWIINWIVDRFRAKVTQLIQKFELLMDQMFIQTKEETQNEETTDYMIRSSFVLSIVVLLIVAVTRFQRD